MREALSKSITRDSSSLCWSTPTITHRIQIVADVFLQYHGFRSGGSLRVILVNPWQHNDRCGDFDIRVRLDPEVLVGTGDGIVPSRATEGS